MNQLNWKESAKELPDTDKEVIGFNIESERMEFGYRVDSDNSCRLWLDFSFPITHWAYGNRPKHKTPPEQSSTAGWQCPSCGFDRLKCPRCGKYYFDIHTT